MPTEADHQRAREDSVRTIVAEAALNIDDEFALLDMLGLMA
ncbi:hypothetical protein [Nonomuraea typhae]|nr:hypothetical protein [Nonomuraea typhae]